MLEKFVTAKLFGKNDCRQGFVKRLIPLIIQGVSGTYYYCEGTPVLVVNPPTKLAKKEKTRIRQSNVKKRT
jgi:hypothetical protein